MPSLPVLLALAAATLVAGCSTPSTLSTPPPDSTAVQGRWLPVQAELAGQAVPDTILQSISLRLDQGRYEVHAGPSTDLGTYLLDTNARPKGMVITGTEGPNQGRTFPAIYELTGDTLRICYDLSGAKRPTEFKTLAGTQLYLVTYHRQTG